MCSCYHGYTQEDEHIYGRRGIKIPLMFVMRGCGQTNRLEYLVGFLPLDIFLPHPFPISHPHVKSCLSHIFLSLYIFLSFSLSLSAFLSIYITPSPTHLNEINLKCCTIFSPPYFPHPYPSSFFHILFSAWILTEKPAEPPLITFTTNMIPLHIIIIKKMIMTVFTTWNIIGCLL